MLSTDSLFSLLSSGMEICRASAAENGATLAGLFLTGLAGSLTHCSGMCGPFVLSQVAARLEAVPAARMREWHRLTGAALVPYHLGRATTYALLGAAAGSLAGTLGGYRILAAALLGVAALVLLAMALPRLKAMLGGGAARDGWWSRQIGRAARPLFAAPTGWRGWGLGVLLGFIPCGLLYAALAAAAATGNVLAAAMGMLAFTAGTVPALVLVGLAGHAAAGRWREPIRKWAPLLLMANAGMLGVMALGLLT